MPTLKLRQRTFVLSLSLLGFFGCAGDNVLKRSSVAKPAIPEPTATSGYLHADLGDRFARRPQVVRTDQDGPARRDSRADRSAEIFRLPAVDQPSASPIQLASFDSSTRPTSAQAAEPPLPVATRVARQPLLGQATTDTQDADRAPDELLPPQAGVAAAVDTVYPIDLANALGLGGASHSQIRLARERIYEAQADFLKAKTAWLPSLRLGVGWNKHDGRLQQTEGDILEISRNSLFWGGGAGLGNASLAGGASGPSRLVVNLSLADAIFEPQVAANLLAERRAASGRTFNNALAQIGRAYFDLLEAHGRLANAHVALQASGDLLELTTAFTREGAGNRADESRARAAHAHQRQLQDEAERQTRAASAELARLVRLDPLLKLTPVEEKMAMVRLIDPSIPVSDLVGQGLAMRPELAQFRSQIGAAGRRVDRERWRPWLPHVQVGASGGSFGGGTESNFDNESGRSDVDLLAVWELQNAGYGNRAARLRTSSQLRQAYIEMQRIRDDIAAEVVTATNDIGAYAEQAEIAMQSAQAAQDSYRLNLQRVRQAEGLPLELLQAIRALHVALDDYTRAVAEHNRSQIELMRAIGQAPAALEEEVARQPKPPPGAAAEQSAKPPLPSGD